MYQLYNIGWALFQYLIRRLILRSWKILNPWDLHLELCNCSEIWPAYWQHCQNSKRCYLNSQSHGFETSPDLTIRRLIRYWNWALVVTYFGEYIIGPYDTVLSKNLWRGGLFHYLLRHPFIRSGQVSRYRYVFRVIRSLLNLTGASAALLLRHLSNFTVIWSLVCKLPTVWLWDHEI